MCRFEAHVDRYPDGREILQKENWICCRDGPATMPWACSRYYEEQDRTLLYDMGRINISGHGSDTSSRRGSSIGESTRSSRARRNSSRREPRPMAGLFLDALMGERRTRTRRSESRTSTSIVIEDRIPRVYPPATPSPSPSPTFRSSYESSTRYSASPMSPASPITPRFSESWEADIVDASPLNRGRRRGTPVVIDNDRRPRRSDSTEVHGARTTARTPSPNYRDAGQREAERTEAEDRRRLRERRLEKLEREIAETHARQKREEERQLHDAAIRARPVVRQHSPPQAHGILRRTSTRAGRDSVIEDLNMSERGEEVLRQAIADKEAAKREESRRLGRRFARGGERIEYRDEYRR